MHSTPRPPDEMDFPRCNTADIEWYVRMSNNAPLVAPKVEMLLGPVEEKGAILEATTPVTDNWLPH